MTFSAHNKAVFDKHADEYQAADYQRTDELILVDTYFTRRPARLLVAGVGGGRTLPMLLERGFEITAVDIAPQMVSATQEKYGKRVRVQEMDIQRTSFPDDSFDYVFLPFHTVCYVDSVEETMRELRRVAKPGGVVIVNALNHYFLKSILDGSFLKGKDRLVRMHRSGEDAALTHHLSTRDAQRIKKIFASVAVFGRSALQAGPARNWKEAFLRRVPFFDKSLYFVAEK